jgi:hypothetical protein
MILKNNYECEDDENLSLPYKEKDKRVVLTNSRWAI